MQVKALLKNQVVRDGLIFAGLLGAALLASFYIGHDLSFASTSMIDPDDNIDAVSDATGGEGDLKDLVKVILNYFLSFLGFVATIMVIYGGILYVTSAGNDDNVGKAKKILMYAATGIILILISFALVNTILGAGLGGDPTNGTAT